MTDINRVFLVGRLTRDAELRFTSAGMPVAKFSIAVNRSKKSGDQWEEEVSYFDIVLWGKIAEALSKYLAKGKQVAIDGELRQNRWEQDGQPRSKVEIHAANIQLLGGSGTQSSGQSAGNGSNFSRQGQGQGKSQPQSGGKSVPFEEYGKESFESPGQFDDDGIPF
ncbi:MAG: single-stranded DNA-binding protein [Spirochaetes bacterium]|nr:single-stranded DNA-binding protein [Spirochaetota bacterium]